MKLEIGKLYCSNLVNFFLHAEPDRGQHGYAWNKEFTDAICAKGSGPRVPCSYIPKCCPFLVLKVAKCVDQLYAQVLYEDRVGWIVGFNDSPDFITKLKA